MAKAKIEKIYAFTRKELMAAFRKWDKALVKTKDGKKYIDNAVYKPAELSDVLIKYLTS